MISRLTAATGLLIGALTAAARGDDLLRCDTPAWTVEHDRHSTATFVRDRGSLTFRYALGPGAPSNQFAALVAPVGGLTSYDRITFTARANHPLRVAVDLRPASTANPPRWRRSIYLDQSPHSVTVAFDDLHRIGTDLRARSNGGPAPTSEPAPLATIGAIMFVIDTNNTRPATDGEIVFTAIALEGPANAAALLY